MVRRFGLILASLLVLTLGFTTSPAASQGTYSPGPPIGASIGTDGSLLLNTGDFEGHIVVEVAGVEVYAGPVDDYTPITNDAVAPGATVIIRGFDSDGNAIETPTTIPEATAPTPTAVPTTAPSQPTPTPVPTTVQRIVTPTPVFVVAPVAPPAAVVVTGTTGTAATTATTASSPALAVTGSSVSLPVVLGTILIASGALAVLTSRRKSSTNL